MKLIGLDVGTKRIGVAKADSAVRIAVPYAAVEVDGTELDKIASLARAWDINSFVVGLPRNSQGQETEQSQYSRQFAAALKQAIPGAKVCFQDESLTSVEAEKRLKGRKKGYKKGDIDSEAATIILQDFLEKHAGKPTSKAAAAKHKSVKGKKPGKSHKLLTAFIVMLVLLGAAAGGAYYFYQDNLQPVFTDVDCSDTEDASSSACKPVKFEVSEGMSVNDIAMNLSSAGLIRNSIVFQVFYRLNYSGTALRPGDYEFTKTMPPSEIIAQMIGGGDAVFRLTLLPGATVSDFSDTLLKLGYDQGDIEKALEKPYTGSYSWIFEGKPDDAGLEGYLYGETYEFYADDTVETIIEQILTEFASVLERNGLKEKFAERGFNLYQGITLASVVQKEANNAIDYAKVAIAFLDSDDLWEPDKLEMQVKWVRKFHARLVFTGSAFIDKDGKRIDYCLNVPKKVVFRELLKQNIISCSSVLVQKKLLLRYPMVGKDMHEDYAVWLSILKNEGICAYGINRPLLIYRVSPKSKSGNKGKAALMHWRVYRHIGLGFIPSVYYFLWYMGRNLKKYGRIWSKLSV